MILFAAAAWANTCSPTTLSELAATEGPAVLVLGERKGTQPDLIRASRLVKKLIATEQSVTVALGAVSSEEQTILDKHASGGLAATDLEGLLDWGATYGFAYAPYAPLVQSADLGARVVAIGVEPEPKPKDTPVPQPPGYLPVLQDAMAGHFMPVLLESRFKTMVTWIDHRMARHAVEGWDRKGVLVVVADRMHVEGGNGISWQAQLMLNSEGIPVKTVLLSGPGRCYAGDLYL